MLDSAAFIAVFDTLAPVFLVVLLGALLRRSEFLTEAFSSSLNKLVFWVALPCLLFTTIASSEFRMDSLDTAAVLMLATLVIAAIAWFGAPLFGVGPQSKGSFTQSVFRSNNAYVGLPIILVAYAGRPEIDAVKSLAMLTLAPCLILYNVLAVFVLTPVDPSLGSRKIAWRRVLLGIATNPLIIGCVLGGVALAGDVKLPPSLSRTLESLSRMAGPGALIALGASLTPARMRAAFRAAHVASFLKLVVCPAVGWCLASAFGLDRDARFVTLVYLASPSAVASFVMAQAMKGDAVLAGGAVAVSTVYSVAALALVLLLAGPVRQPSPPATGAIAAPVRLRVAVSIPPQQGIVRHIAGDLVDVETLIAANQNPHTYEPTAKQLVRLGETDVLFTVGLPFERTLLPRLATSHPRLRVVDATAGYPVLTIEGEAHDHGHEDETGTADPHLWLAPAGILHQAAVIAAELIRLDPEQEIGYRAGLARLTAETQALDDRFRALLAPHAGQTFYVYHPAWGHFAQAYGLRQMAVEQHGGTPSARYVAELIEAARRDGVRGVLVQSKAEEDRVRPLFGSAGLNVLRVPPLEADPLVALEATGAAVLAALPPATATPSP
jgi:ABC-type Zn uptake system ZnuABC Zn-binding protein ZnuA